MRHTVFNKKPQKQNSATLIFNFRIGSGFLLGFILLYPSLCIKITEYGIYGNSKRKSKETVEI